MNNTVATCSSITEEKQYCGGLHEELLDHMELRRCCSDTTLDAYVNPAALYFVNDKCPAVYAASKMVALQDGTRCGFLNRGAVQIAFVSPSVQSFVPHKKFSMAVLRTNLAVQTKIVWISSTIRLTSDQPSAEPSLIPISNPSLESSSEPSFSLNPSSEPSLIPLSKPSSIPSLIQISNPSLEPSSNPSNEPSVVPSTDPSMSPTLIPSNEPSSLPSDYPTFDPSKMPSLKLSLMPSNNPLIYPSIHPSEVPSTVPSLDPLMDPSLNPSDMPSLNPLLMSSLDPSIVPSTKPSLSPSSVPSYVTLTKPSLEPSTTSLKPSLNPTSAPSDEEFECRWVMLGKEYILEESQQRERLRLWDQCLFCIEEVAWMEKEVFDFCDDFAQKNHDSHDGITALLETGKMLKNRLHEESLRQLLCLDESRERVSRLMDFCVLVWRNI